MSAQPFERVTLDQLTIEDADAFKHVELFDELKTVLLDARYHFRVGATGALSWDRAVFLNLAYWADGAGGGDVLIDRTIPADVVMHVAWHHLAAARLRSSLREPGTAARSSPPAGIADADLLGEAIASAFDLYLVGRSLGHAESSFLETQVPAMADVARSAGLEDEDMERLLDEVATDPDKAFEDLRVLLFETTRDLVAAESADAAMVALDRRRGHRFSALLHHYELASWVANARARSGQVGGARPDRSDARVDAMELHVTLCGAPSSVEWLRDNWVAPAIRRRK